MPSFSERRRCPPRRRANRPYYHDNDRSPEALCNHRAAADVARRCNARRLDHDVHPDRPRLTNGARDYTPVARTITITTVPLLVREQEHLLPFLKADFAKGGVLDGKEVYAFSPSSVTVIEGDTIHFVFINPEDDVHSFV